MPRQIKAWSCEFGCGRIRVSRESIEKHEPTCFLNPARRSCKTCKHEQFDVYEAIPEEGFPGRDVRVCYRDVPKEQETQFEKHDICWECPSWEPK
jgi:hypothetical protein